LFIFFSTLALLEKNTLSVLLSSLCYEIAYNGPVVHFECTFVVAFLEAIIALLLPIVARVLVILRLLGWFWLLLRLLCWAMIPGTLLIMLLLSWLLSMLLVLMVGVHEPIIQYVRKLVENVAVLPHLLTGWLVEAKHGEGVEAEEHYYGSIR
jgi:hypothetical protein